MALSDEERAVVEFAGRWYHQAGAREQAIRDELNMTPVRYAQVLNGLIDRMDAAVEYPTITRQMREQRDRRLLQKTGRRRIQVA